MTARGRHCFVVPQKLQGHHSFCIRETEQLLEQTRQWLNEVDLQSVPK